MPPDVIARVRYYDVSAPKRDFYSSAQKDDYLGYIDKGVQSTKAIDYLDYTDNGEKSSGAFGAEGLLTKFQKKELREKLRTTQSCIWDMVVSFEEGYGKSNLTDAAAAIVYKATWEDEKSFVCTVGTLAETARKNNITKTALMIIGDVVAHNGYDRSKLYDPGFTTEFRKGTDSI